MQHVLNLMLIDAPAPVAVAWAQTGKRCLPMYVQHAVGYALINVPHNPSIRVKSNKLNNNEKKGSQRKSIRLNGRARFNPEVHKRSHEAGGEHALRR